MLQRLLSAQASLSLPVDKLLRGLSSSTDLLVSQAPSERKDPQTEAPTIDALLRELVDTRALEYLSKLGLYGTKSFDLVFAARVWQVASAQPIVRSLHARGLIDAVGDGRFVIPPLMLRLGRLLRDKSSTSADAERQLDVALEMTEGRDPAAEAEIRIERANVRANRGHYSEAIESYRFVLDRDPPVAGKLQAKVLGYLGNAQRNLGRYKEAAVTYGDAISLYEHANDRAGQSLELFNLGITLRELGNHAGQTQALEQARAC